MIRKLIEDFVSLIYPVVCAGCNGELARSEQVLCTRCRAGLPRTYNFHHPYNELYLKFKGRIPIKYAFSFLTYSKSGATKKLLQTLKYYGNRDLGKVMGEMYGSELADWGYKNVFDVIVPVPLHKKRLKERGFNQSEAFAEGLATFLHGEIFPGAVIRTKSTLSQTQFKGEERWKNVQNIFQVVNPEKFEGKDLLLVDDVITTGATIESLAVELVKYNPKSLSIAAIAEAV